MWRSPQRPRMTTQQLMCAFMFNVPPGDATITATKSGVSFHAHLVKARADKFTTTSITP